MTSEIPTTFTVEGATLIGMLHLPDRASRLGVVLVVGGPQYRVGSHRQFLLLARDLAARGIPVLRFDCRGMGDSAGEFPGFENIGPDVAGAMDALVRNVPSITHLVLWGLCDATLTICQCAERDSRVAGVVLLNPWVRNETSQARAHIRHYYLQRLTEKDFLLKLLRGKLNPFVAGRSLLVNLYRAVLPESVRSRGPVRKTGQPNPLAQQMAASLGRFRGAALLILSGRDLTAKEFEDAANRSKPWQRLYAEDRLTVRHLEPADHTFSQQPWRDQVSSWTSEWINALRRTDP